MDFKTASLAECLKQLELLDMKDTQGHPLKGSAAFQRLLVLADPDPVFELRTFNNEAEYRSYAQSQVAANASLPLPNLLGYFTGHPLDIQDYFRDKEVGYFACNALRPAAISSEMAAEKNATRKRIKELEAELAALKSKK